jgi:hypothetical protein
MFRACIFERFGELLMSLSAGRSASRCFMHALVRHLRPGAGGAKDRHYGRFVFRFGGE